jgi:hypothetical protein
MNTYPGQSLSTSTHNLKIAVAASSHPSSSLPSSSPSPLSKKGERGKKREGKKRDGKKRDRGRGKVSISLMFYPFSLLKG